MMQIYRLHTPQYPHVEYCYSQMEKAHHLLLLANVCLFYFSKILASFSAFALKPKWKHKRIECYNLLSVSWSVLLWECHGCELQCGPRYIGQMSHMFLLIRVTFCLYKYCKHKFISNYDT
jgi:hypothetical protein